MKKAIVTGVLGQDGAYLAELLLSKNYIVYGLHRRSSNLSTENLHYLGIHNHSNLSLIEGDLLDLSTLIRIIQECEPDEIYNLGAQSHVRTSFSQPINTCQITGMGVLNILEAIRLINPKIKFYQASSSEMFGKVCENPQKETTPFHPRSPYGVAKVFAHWMCINYRESYDLFTTSGILFNHESPLRGKEFVTRKITDGFAKIVSGQLDCLKLGNLDAKRDWGYAQEYVEGMWQMMQLDQPGEFVLATGKSFSVREFAAMTAKAAGINLCFKGSGVEEVGIDDKTGKTLIRVDPKYFRSAEVDFLLGDASKAFQTFGWKPKTSLEQLCHTMYNSDLKRNEQAIHQTC